MVAADPSVIIFFIFTDLYCTRTVHHVCMHDTYECGPKEQCASPGRTWLCASYCCVLLAVVIFVCVGSCLRVRHEISWVVLADLIVLKDTCCCCLCFCHGVVGCIHSLRLFRHVLMAFCCRRLDLKYVATPPYPIKCPVLTYELPYYQCYFMELYSG